MDQPTQPQRDVTPLPWAGGQPPAPRAPAALERPIRAQAFVSRSSGKVHLVHGILSVLTLGGWVPIWIAYAITARTRPLEVRVDTYGNVVATYQQHG